MYVCMYVSVCVCVCVCVSKFSLKRKKNEKYTRRMVVSCDRAENKYPQLKLNSGRGRKSLACLSLFVSSRQPISIFTDRGSMCGNLITLHYLEGEGSKKREKREREREEKREEKREERGRIQLGRL